MEKCKSSRPSQIEFSLPQIIAAVLMLLQVTCAKDLSEVNLRTITHSQGKLVLQCSFHWQEAYIIQWSKDDKQICEYNHTIPGETPTCNTQHWRLGKVKEYYQELFIDEKRENDTGIYTCSVLDLHKLLKEDKLTITKSFTPLKFWISRNGTIASNVSCSESRNIPMINSSTASSFTCSSSGYATNILPSSISNLQTNSSTFRIQCSWNLSSEATGWIKHICVDVRVATSEKKDTENNLPLILGCLLAGLVTGLAIAATCAVVILSKINKKYRAATIPGEAENATDRKNGTEAERSELIPKRPEEQVKAEADTSLLDQELKRLKKILQDKRPELVESLNTEHGLFDFLIRDKVTPQRVKSDMDKGSREDNATDLLEYLATRGLEDIQNFVKALGESGQGHLAKLFDRKEEKDA